MKRRQPDHHPQILQFIQAFVAGEKAMQNLIEVGQQIAVGDFDPLGMAGGTGCVLQKGNLIRLRLVRLKAAVQGLIQQLIQSQTGHAVTVSQLLDPVFDYRRQRLIGNNGTGITILGHFLQTIQITSAHRGVSRYRYAARIQAAKKRPNIINARGKQQQHIAPGQSLLLQGHGNGAGRLMQ